MFKRYILPFIAGQLLSFYTVCNMFDVSLGSSEFWESNLKSLMYLLCVLYTMTFSSMAHYCKQSDLRKKLEKENKEIKSELEQSKNSNEMLRSVAGTNFDLSSYKQKTEFQELREMIESLKDKK